jgi:hypothetical protein
LWSQVRGEIARESPVEGVVTVGEEGSRSSGLVNAGLVTDYRLRYCSSVQVDRESDNGLPCSVWRGADFI